MIPMYLMNDTDVSPVPEARAAQCPWLLLVYQLPLEPAYLRVKVSRRIKRLGAVPLTEVKIPSPPAASEVIRSSQ